MKAPSATLEHGPQTVRLGRIPATPEMLKRCLPLGPFLKKYGGKPPPAKVDYAASATAALADMLGNNQAGCCVISAELHGIGVWTANEPGGKPSIPTAKESLSQYASICGPGDNGCYIPAVLEHFRDKGLTAGGTAHKIDGFVTVNPRDQLLVQYAQWLFGGLNLGVNWPSEWMSIRPGFVLKPSNSRMVGGHSVMVVGYDDVGLQISTWGIVGTLSWAALADPRFVDECYARLGADWYNDAGVTAAGVDVGPLREALKTVAAGGYPDIPTEPTPPTPPPTPTPPGAGVWSGTGYVDFLGTHMPAVLSGSYGLYGHATAASPNVWAVLADLAQIYTAVLKRDWYAVAVAVQQLLGDLGLNLTPDETCAMCDALTLRLVGYRGDSNTPVKS